MVGCPQTFGHIVYLATPVHWSFMSKSNIMVSAGDEESNHKRKVILMFTLPQFYNVLNNGTDSWIKDAYYYASFKIKSTVSSDT